jgi:hypothetical protein
MTTMPPNKGAGANRRPALPLLYYGLGDSEVAGFGERRGRAAVAQLGRSASVAYGGAHLFDRQFTIL